VFLCVGITEEGVARVCAARYDGRFKYVAWRLEFLDLRFFSQSSSLLHISPPGENKFGIIMVFIDGLTMCFSLWRTADLWFAIGNHASWDWGQTFVFGTPNSGLHGQHALMNPAFHGPTLLGGGTNGPEGSVVLLSEVLFLVLIAIIFRRRRFPLITDRWGETLAS